MYHLINDLAFDQEKLTFRKINLQKLNDAKIDLLKQYNNFKIIIFLSKKIKLKTDTNKNVNVLLNKISKISFAVLSNKIRFSSVCFHAYIIK